MIRTIGMTSEGFNPNELSIDEALSDQYVWCWVDIENPNQDEIDLLSNTFHFQKLSIGDCLLHLNRPKVDFFGDYKFIVAQALKEDCGENADTLCSEEVNIFLTDRFVVTVHKEKNDTVERAMMKMKTKEPSFFETRTHQMETTTCATYLVMDELVDDFFPTLQRVEEKLDAIENLSVKENPEYIFNAIYDIRSDILKIRKVVNPMRDLVYRIINSERLNLNKEYKNRFKSIHEHLLRLSERLVDDREITADIIENVNSMLSHKSNDLATKTNDIVLLLTKITVVFTPLTLIVGLYGMNFDNMPELHWKYGYVMVWFMMIAIVLAGGTFFFKRKSLFK